MVQDNAVVTAQVNIMQRVNNLTQHQQGQISIFLYKEVLKIELLLIQLWTTQFKSWLKAEHYKTKTFTQIRCLRFDMEIVLKSKNYNIDFDVYQAVT